MPNRTAKFVSAIFAGILANAPLATTSHGETVAADNCLSGPKGQTPAGSHWYYRIEHPTNRHCWYLRDERGQASQAAPQAEPQGTSLSANPLPPQADAALHNSVANARAELPARSDLGDPVSTASSTKAAGFDTAGANAPDAGITSSLVASRWPEPSGVSPASSPRPATAQLATSARASSIAAPATAATITLAALNSSTQNWSDLIPKLLVAIASALTMAGITASLIYIFGRARTPVPGELRARGPIWEETDDDRIALSGYPDIDALPRRPRFSRNIGEAGDPDDRAAEFFSRISRRSPT